MTVPYLNRLGFTARGRHERCRSVDLFFLRPGFRTPLGVFLKMPQSTAFKTAPPTALLVFVPLQDRRSSTRTGPRCVACLAPRHAATLAFLSPQHPAASSQAERNNPDPNIFQGRTSRRQNVRSVRGGECARLRNHYPASVQNCD